MVKITEEVTVTRIGNSLRVVIPRTIAKALQIKAGEVLLEETTDGEILLTRPGHKKKG